MFHLFQNVPFSAKRLPFLSLYCFFDAFYSVQLLLYAIEFQSPHPRGLAAPAYLPEFGATPRVLAPRGLSLHTARAIER
jgi:hypothetical protein